MSESTPAVPEPILPKKRRRWVLVLLAMLLAVGGAYGWLTRLTPDERIFVGRWKSVRPSTVPPAKEVFVELFSDRTGNERHANDDEIRFHWTADQGELSYWLEQPFHRLVLQWVQNGFKDWGDGETYRYEIIDQDKIKLLYFESGPEAFLLRMLPE